ncbi:hypothetical protein GSY74_04140 [Sulfurovum sp. bin170]|uniref:hypothetical protein n=1 Tax=Sulfurovum sp. bin170 TaxID=2695268 RepID=UPI0013DEC16D|nr:hypothetical protein [Sulfurovum sp. bin170]NEW60464.1 hypothetical protein [Sulfurovum sp. bin170]
MIRTIFILFSTLTMASIFLTYQGTGLAGVESIEKPKPTVRSSSSSNYGGSSSYSGGYSSGK